MNKIVAFDVETPNFNNNRICSIGIAVIENGDITQSYYYLINPECAFDYRNIKIHGIRPEDVADAPTFPKIWNMIDTLLRTNLVIAHNATFDLGVLRKTLQAYGINESSISYVDTLAIANLMIKEIENYKLSTLCKSLDISLDHHNACSDSLACAKILCRLLNDGAELDRHIESYSLDTIISPTKTYMPFQLNANNQALLTLNDILSDITYDNILMEAEGYYLQEWMDENSALKGNYPYDKIYSTLASALADGILEKAELDYMLKLFKQIIDPVNENVCDCKKIDIIGKNICLSGEFDCGSKSDVNEKLISYGACIHTTITKKTDILIVGGKGNFAWSSENYGNKVKKALEMQEKGINILLIREADLFAVLEE